MWSKPTNSSKFRIRKLKNLRSKIRAKRSKSDAIANQQYQYWAVLNKLEFGKRWDQATLFPLEWMNWSIFVDKVIWQKRSKFIARHKQIYKSLLSTRLNHANNNTVHTCIRFCFMRWPIFTAPPYRLYSTHPILFFIFLSQVLNDYRWTIFDNILWSIWYLNDFTAIFIFAEEFILYLRIYIYINLFGIHFYSKVSINIKFLLIFMPSF